MRAEGILPDLIDSENVKLVDEAVNKPLPTTPTQEERSPLAEVDSNSVDGAVVDPESGALDRIDEAEEKDMGGKKGKSGKKKTQKTKKGGKNAAKTKEESVGDGGVALPQQGEVASDEAPQVAEADNTVEEPIKQQDPASGTIQDTRPSSPEAPITRSTRSQRAKQEDLTFPNLQELSMAPEPKVLKQEGLVPTTVQGGDASEDMSQGPQDPSHNDAHGTTAQSENQDDASGTNTPAKDWGSNTDTLTVEAGLSVVSSKTNTPAPLSSQGTPKPALRPEDSIDALDALEDALDQVGKSLQKLDVPLSPEKPKHKHEQDEERWQRLSKERAASMLLHEQFDTSARNRPTGQKLSTVLKARNAALSRITNGASKLTASSSNKPTSTLGRSASVRAAPSKPTSIAEKSSKPTAPSTKENDNKTTDYLASRRRPISLQFPTPPPPPKSNKVPTRPTFQLPGEAIAAKLKAAREERLKREEEEVQKRREFKARPNRNSMQPSMPVKQTASSRARQSLINGESISSSATGSNKENMSIKRATSVREANVTKRLSTAAMSAAAKRASVVATPSSSSSISNPKPRTGTDNTAKRASVIANTSKSRNASVGPTTSATATAPAAATTKATVTAADVVTQRAKAREIFNRDKVEKEQREKERREKEDAAKKARAEAAERGRQASREWAEKQKKLKKERATALAKLTGGPESGDPEKLRLPAL
ncbi:hypothetical protein NA57DRAFT_74370 [Rhizodiscina lignyota]|uniref:Carboxylesterase family protein n=1 Tax=Rhizodiscina lignyota TaxID=1504668 RepID=A0A9P4ILS4_9PEZI|nr:hypothetical protein NA57DRAFT_74370 [Rhizodiscina lignyota]